MLRVQTQGTLRPEYKAAIDVNEKAIYNDSSGQLVIGIIMKIIIIIIITFE